MYSQDNLEEDSSFCKRVLWSDETKVELIGHRNTAYVSRKKGKALNPKNTEHIILPPMVLHLLT